MKNNEESSCGHLFGNTLDGGLISRADIEAGTYSFRDLVFKFQHCPKCRARLTIFGEHHIQNSPPIAFREYTILGEEGNRTALKVSPPLHLFKLSDEDTGAILYYAAANASDAVEMAEEQGYCTIIDDEIEQVASSMICPDQEGEVVRWEDNELMMLGEECF